MISPLAIPQGWMWSAWQPDRGMAFNSYLFGAGDAAAVDPLELDADGIAQIEALGGLQTVVLTNRDHRRAAAALRARFNCAIAVSREEAPLFDIPIDRTFSDGEEIFRGAFAIGLEGGKTPGEVAIHLPRHKAAIVGDALIGTPAGSLSFLGSGKLADPAALALSLRRLWALQLDSLLLCDGLPLFGGADAALGVLIETQAGPAANRINIDELSWKDDRVERYRIRDAEIGFFIGARQLGYRLAEIPPGNRFCPLHSHDREEEMFFVLEGEPSIRTPRGTMRCRRGDVIAFPTGDRGAHQLLNESASPCKLLLLGMNSPEYEVCCYPDSNKILVETHARRLMLRAAPVLDYYDGELAGHETLA